MRRVQAGHGRWGGGSTGPAGPGDAPGRRMVSPQASPGAQVRRGRARTHAAAGSLSRRPPVPAGRPPPGARGLTCLVAAAPPASAISQPGPQLRPPPRRMPAGGIIAIAAASAHPGAAASRGAEAQSRRRRGRRPLRRPLGLGAPACPRAPGRLAGLASPGAGGSRRRDLRSPRRAVSGAPFCPLGKWGLPEAGKS